MSISISNPTGGAGGTTQDLTNYVPYVGATSDLNLGAYVLTANAVSSRTDIVSGNDVVIAAGNKLILDGT